MATYTTVSVTRSGVEGTYTTTTESDTFGAGTGVLLHVKNGSENPATPTFITPGKVAEMDVSDRTGDAVSAGGERFYGPFPPSLFATADGQVTVTWSASGEGITAAVIRVS